MAAKALCFTAPFFSPLRIKPQFAASAKRFVSCSASLPSSAHSLSLRAILSPQPSTSDPSSSSSSLKGQSRKARVCTALGVVDEEAVIAEEINGEKYVEPENDDVSGEKETKKVGRPCEVYVCNIPRSCDSTQLLDMFKPYGNVLAAEVLTSYRLF